jgi:multicomponent Na+:H+ antiporter subunit D
MEIVTIRLVLALLAPVLGALLVLLAGKHPNLREACSFAAATVLFAIVASLVPDVLTGSKLSYHLFQILPGISVSLRADYFSMIFALVASFLWMVTVFYSLGYMRGLQEHAQTRFNACFALALFGSIGCAFSDNLFTLYLFYEVVSISTYPLVAHHQDQEGYDAGKKYLVYLITTVKGMVLPAMVGIYFLTGTLDFADNIHSGIISAGNSRPLVTLLYICCLLGFAKNAIMPFHNWLPSAMVAPTPVSALLHAVAVVKVGVFSTSRVMLYVFGVNLMNEFNLGIPTAYFVAITILLGSIIALSKDDLKALLAYSTVSQLSYVILGVALLTPSGIEGGLVHIANHAFSKITLFFCAGAIYVATHKKNISQMSGLGQVMPWTFSAFAIASLSMIGVPPVAGFVSKWFLVVGSLEAHQIGILVILLVSTLLNAGYFVPVTYRAFFGRLAPADRNLKEAAPALVIPLLITAAISIAIGIFPDFFLSLVKGVLR